MGELIARILRLIFGTRLVPADAEAVLAARALEHGEHLDWRYSIVDLLKVLDLDSSLEARKRLADELGNPDYVGSASQNIWLHAEVMKRVKSGEYR